MKTLRTDTKILFHFCSARDIEKIKAEGLTKGLCPIINGSLVRFIANCQWLTLNGNPDKQTWATSHMIDYSRTDYRLTISIPRKHTRALFKAKDFIQDAVPKRSQYFVTNYPGADDWYVYRGAILPKWIRNIEKMEG